MKKTIITIVAAALAFGVHAQQDSSLLHSANPLLTATGPNVLGGGGLMLEGMLGGQHYHDNYTADGSNFWWAGCGATLRYGVGSSAELTLGLRVGHLDGIYKQQSVPANNLSVVSSVGARLKLYDGGLHWYLPRVTFYTTIGLPYRQGRVAQLGGETVVEPTIGLQMRHHAGRRWMVDWALGYSWNEHFPQFVDGNGPQFLLAVRWLPTERWLLSVGAELGQTWLEARWQASRTLQLSAQAGISAAAALSSSGDMVDVNALLGVSWLIR